jgi:hypothetical protein
MPSGLQQGKMPTGKHTWEHAGMHLLLPCPPPLSPPPPPGSWHVPDVHSPAEQSRLVSQPSPMRQLGQSDPPQSTSVSAPFCMPSAQLMPDPDAPASGSGTSPPLESGAAQLAHSV